MKKLLFSLLTLLIFSGALFAQDMEFRCNMTVQILEGNFNPETDTVDVRGTLNGWTPGASIMEDADGDSIYTFVLEAVGADSSFEFKYGGYFSGADTWEAADNRTYTTTGTDDFYSAFFADDEEVNLIFGDPKQLTFVYQVDMELEILSGRFDVNADTCELRGERFGWGPGIMMEPNTINQFIYEYEDTLTVQIGTTTPGYKFWYTPNAWESVDNRIHVVTQAEYNAGFVELSHSYNDGSLETVTDHDLTIIFTVDTDGAISSGNSLPFTQVDNVILCGSAAPLQWPDTGWPTADADATIPMFDDGTNGDATAADGIWSVTVTYNAYSPLAFEYKYGINFGLDALNQGGNDNENAIGANHQMTLTQDMNVVTTEDAFGFMGPSTITGLEEDLDASLPVSYKLEQNYPNPFNPTTAIKFNLPEAGMVSLKIFNVLGQQVAELVNEVLNAGSYNYNFDASSLSSGVYVYSIQAADFVQTKKMVLLK